jgi:hypothetical protein
MKKIIILFLAVTLSFSNCANKKKKALLFPFLALLNSEDTVTEPVSSNAGTQYSVPPAPVSINNSNSETFVVSSGDNSYSVSPTDSTQSSESSTLTSALPTAGVSVSSATQVFSFQTTVTYPVTMTVTDSENNIVTGAVVTIQEINEENGESTVVFQQVTDSSGYVEGSFTVSQAISQVEATVTVGSETSKPVPIPLEVAVTDETGASTNYPISSINSVTIPGKVQTPSGLADRDGDGVPDSIDFFPDDPTKASRVRIPGVGVHTVAFEDLFPSAGDADLNDYVIQFFNEEILNAKGEVVEIRGEYQHVAKGAGYKHNLNLRLPTSYQVCLDDKDKGHGNNESGTDADNPGASTGINQNALDNRNRTKFKDASCKRTETVGLDVSFESTIFDGNDVDTKTGKVRYNPSLEEIRDGFEILGDSSKTISSANVDPNRPYRPGHRAVVSIQFNKPIPKSQLGNAPYDLFIRILSKKIDNRYPAQAPRAENAGRQFYEVHFPGYYFAQNGKDVYLDSKGFPWAILIPSAWAWPLEGRTFDIRGTKSAYPKFKAWMESGGQVNKDWYLHPDRTYAFPLPEVSSSLSAFLKDVDSISVGLALGIILTGMGILFLRKKFILN